MRLTTAEMNIMEILWASEPKELTTDEIRQSPLKNSSWKDDTIYVILRSLLKKHAVDTVLAQASWGEWRKHYRPIMSCEKYFALQMAQTSQKIDFPALKSLYFTERLKAADRLD